MTSEYLMQVDSQWTKLRIQFFSLTNKRTTCHYIIRFKFLTWHEYSYFLRFIPGFNDICSVVGDVSVDNETSMVISSISRYFCQSFIDAYKGRVCAHVDRGECVCMNVCIFTVICKTEKQSQNVFSLKKQEKARKHSRKMKKKTHTTRKKLTQLTSA